jgi:hypothetical protein
LGVFFGFGREFFCFTFGSSVLDLHFSHRFRTGSHRFRTFFTPFRTISATRFIIHDVKIPMPAESNPDLESRFEIQFRFSKNNPVRSSCVLCRPAATFSAGRSVFAFRRRTGLLTDGRMVAGG